MLLIPYDFIAGEERQTIRTLLLGVRSRTHKGNGEKLNCSRVELGQAKTNKYVCMYIEIIRVMHSQWYNYSSCSSY